MTNDELFEDLKQFINIKIDSVENQLEAKIDGVEARLSKRLDNLEEDVADIKTVQNEILNAVGQDIQEVKTVQQNHEARLNKLEAKTA